MVLFIMPYKVVLTIVSVNEILKATQAWRYRHLVGEFEILEVVLAIV